MHAPTLALLAALLLAPPTPAHFEDSALRRELARAARALDDGRTDVAGKAIEGALERDPGSIDAWELRARWARSVGDQDREVRSLHRALELARSQDLDGIRDREAAIVDADPIARDLFGLRERFAPKLREVAARYEKDGWPHAAIAVHKEILALDPNNHASEAAIARLASAPDPSLASDARAVDLLEGISAEWIEEHDRKHATWKKRAKLEGEHYVTQTDAGYEVLVRSAAAMEQMNAFYRVFFQYGVEEHGKKVPRIDLRIFRDSAEYLELGSGPPVKWSGGQFTGDSVETYIGPGGFQEVTGTLFHEAAHQFVSLATSAAGWLNEGLASFFEGSRLLANGTVITNLPADHRLFPLAERMEKGWMRSADDGITADPDVVPPTAPTFRIVLENDYDWGPAWYAPTWGVVYFLYNYQDPTDGRFVYRGAFREYIDRSGGLTGDAAVKTFEEIVLGQPEAPTRGVEFPADASALPTTVDDLSALWKEWILALRDRENGSRKADTPWARWAQYAILRGDTEAAREFFEKGIDETPDSPELLLSFGRFLIEQDGGVDRGVRLLRLAARAFEKQPESEEIAKRLSEVHKLLDRNDPERKRLARIHAEILRAVTGIAQRYLDEDLNRQAMAVAWRFAREFDDQQLLETYRKAVASEGESLARWQLAYNEENLDGWAKAGVRNFTPSGPYLDAEFSDATGAFDYRFLTLDRVTSGDFSIEAEVQVLAERATFAGLVFGRKSASDFHALILFPPSGEKLGYADLTTFHGGDSFDTWRHEPISGGSGVAEDTAGPWHRLRIDVTGNTADMWVDGEEVASQDFPSRAVLRGSFGLLTGVGHARFRRVRFLARDPKDPASAIERALRLSGNAAGTEGAESEAGDPVDTSSNGSWVGLHPPFPTVDHWLRGERTSWRERRGHPQLLVLFSMDQNEVLPVDVWLASLARDHSDVGLEVLGVMHTWDRDGAEEFVRDSPFPGAIALDAPDGTESLGKTFQAYSIDRYQVPRLLLIDVDGRVAWEGAPGFSAGQPWRGEKTFLDTPLESLLRRRRLSELADWKEAWKEARNALRRGEFEEAWPVLEQASDFDAELFPDVAEARRMRSDLLHLFESFDSVAGELLEQGRAPAATVILEWARATGHEVTSPLVRKLSKHASQKDWDRALAFLKPALRDIAAGKDPVIKDRILERMEGIGGAFAPGLVADLRAAKDDPARTADICRTASGRPARWVLEDLLHW